MTATPGVTSDQGAVPAAAGPGVGMRIQSRLPQMSQAMAKIASLLLESPDAPLRLSITELAESAGTSPATVTRFCRTIGFSGYVPRRVAVASDVGRERARETWSEDIGRAFGPDDSPTQVMSTLLSAHTRSLHETAELIDLALKDPDSLWNEPAEDHANRVLDYDEFRPASLKKTAVKLGLGAAMAAGAIWLLNHKRKSNGDAVKAA